MPEKPDWGKQGVLAAWVLGVPTIALAVLAYVKPPDPAHPMSLDFLSRNVAFPPWFILIVFLLTVICTAAVVRGISKKSTLSTQLQNPITPEAPTLVAVNFKHQVAKLDQRATSVDVHYTAKIRVVVENTGDKPAQILPPFWTTGKDNVSVQVGAAFYPGVEYKPGMLDFGHRYQLEEYKGGWKSGKWRKLPNGIDDERLELFVEPGWAFRIWIGLSPTVPHAVLERKLMTKSLGKLTLPVDIAGVRSEWSVDL
jgi:hypothetical protein